MSNETIPARANGQAIDDSWFNLLRSVLNGSLFPRTAGVATDQGGSLGDSSYRWLAAYLYSLVIMNGTKGVTLAAPSDLASDFQMTLPSSLPGSTLPLLVSSAGLMSFGSITKAMIEALGHSVSSSCGTFLTSGSSYTDVTNLSVSITTVGKPVYVGLTPDTSNPSAEVDMTNASADSGIQILRDSTVIYKLEGLVTTPAGGVWAFDEPAAGTYTYKVQAKGTGSSTSLTNLRLLAYQVT